MLNPWADQMQQSPTLAIAGVASKLVEEGRSLFNFGIGEMNPGIPVPQLIKEEMVKSILADETHYTAAIGDPELRKAICVDLKFGFGLSYECDEVCICPGPKDAIFKALLTILSPGSAKNSKSSGSAVPLQNGVVAFAPFFESFVNLPMLCTGREAIVLETDAQFLPVPAALEAALKGDPTIAAVILNSPNNPTGAVYPEALIRKLTDVVRRYPHVWVISDEVYRMAVYPAYSLETSDSPDHKESDSTKPSPAVIKHFSIASLLPQQTILVGGMSKEVSGTGLRVGFAAAPRSVVKMMQHINGNTSACVSLPTQKAYARFLKADTDLKHRRAIVQQLHIRRNLIFRLLSNTLLNPAMSESSSTSAQKWTAPTGAFYFFPNVTHLFGCMTADGTHLESDEDVALYLLNHASVVTIPGSKFGRAGCLRLAYAQPLDSITKGATAIQSALALLTFPTNGTTTKKPRVS